MENKWINEIISMRKYKCSKYIVTGYNETKYEKFKRVERYIHFQILPDEDGFNPFHLIVDIEAIFSNIISNILMDVYSKDSISIELSTKNADIYLPPRSYKSFHINKLLEKMSKENELDVMEPLLLKVIIMKYPC